MILNCPNHFCRVPFVLVGSNSFWSGPNHYGQVPIIKVSLEKSNLNLTKIMWPQPKQFGPDQNNLHLSKTIWTVQNDFGPIEGQVISFFQFYVPKIKNSGDYCLSLT